MRSRQDSNLRSQRESDFESDALTTRPRLLRDFDQNIKIFVLFVKKRLHGK
jgi:hypothetical protein